jgi:hypothetical protein
MRQPRRGQPLDLTPGPGSELLVDRPRGEKQVRWTTVLVWFMRILAAIWLFKGLAAWAGILGITLPPPPFEQRQLGYQATTIYFAVLDLVAAVGLWLASTWGGVLWLLAVVSHLILAVFFPRFVPNGALMIGLFILAITAYLVVSWLAANDE